MKLININGKVQEFGRFVTLEKESRYEFEYGEVQSSSLGACLPRVLPSLDDNAEGHREVFPELHHSQTPQPTMF